VRHHSSQVFGLEPKKGAFVTPTLTSEVRLWVLHTTVLLNHLSTVTANYINISSLTSLTVIYILYVSKRLPTIRTVRRSWRRVVFWCGSTTSHLRTHIHIWDIYI
jgi:hypothetical protein